jgi:hypothetical protein
VQPGVVPGEVQPAPAAVDAEELGVRGDRDVDAGPAAGILDRQRGLAGDGRDRALGLTGRVAVEQPGERARTAQVAERSQAGFLMLVLTYLPDIRLATTEAAGLRPAACFQNASSGLSHSAWPILSMTTEPSPWILIVPAQPRVPRVRFSATCCPELSSDPATCTDETTLRSAAVAAPRMAPPVSTAATARRPACRDVRMGLLLSGR